MKLNSFKNEPLNIQQHELTLRKVLFQETCLSVYHMARTNQIGVDCYYGMRDMYYVNGISGFSFYPW